MDQWYGGLLPHQTLTVYLNCLTPKTCSTNKFTCRFQYSVSGIKLATNSNTIKIQQVVFTYKVMNNLTAHYTTDSLKPVAETHNHTLRSSVNGALAVPILALPCLIGHICIQHPNCGIRLRFQFAMHHLKQVSKTGPNPYYK